MQDELTLLDDTTSLDDVFFVQGKSYSVNDYLLGVDEILSKIKDTNDFMVGAHTLRSMSAIGHAIGISKAKLVYGLRLLWSADEESFYQFVTQHAQLSRVVVDRYIDAWNAITIVPDNLVEMFISRPMKDLNALGAAISQGYIPENEDWDNLASASSNQEFLQIIREDLKGKPARKNSITIYLEQSGDLIAWVEGVPKHIGYLKLDGDENITRAVNRIIRSSGLILR